MVTIHGDLEDFCTDATTSEERAELITRITCHYIDAWLPIIGYHKPAMNITAGKERRTKETALEASAKRRYR